jgi:hypothetical protein
VEYSRDLLASAAQAKAAGDDWAAADAPGIDTFAPRSIWPSCPEGIHRSPRRTHRWLPMSLSAECRGSKEKAIAGVDVSVSSFLLTIVRHPE